MMSFRRKDILLEAGEDEENENPTDRQADANNAQDDAQDDATTDDADNEVEVPNEYDGLDLVSASCFGYSFPKSKSWLNLAKVAIDVGWSNINAKQLEDSLMHNIENCYHRIAQFKLSNINDDMTYLTWFDNNRGLWDVNIANSPKAELTIDQRANFFKSEMFKKITKQAYHVILDAKQTYNQIVKQHIIDGELIDIDVVKLDAILHFIDRQYFLDNLLNGKIFKLLRTNDN